jgi:hypothetical protein
MGLFDNKVSILPHNLAKKDQRHFAKILAAFNRKLNTAVMSALSGH